MIPGEGISGEFEERPHPREMPLLPDVNGQVFREKVCKGGAAIHSLSFSGASSSLSTPAENTGRYFKIDRSQSRKRRPAARACRPLRPARTAPSWAG